MIEFGTPWGLAFLASIPIIVLLHALRPRRRSVLVSTAALWREALGERRRGMGWQRLLRDLSLLLLLALAAVLALALTDPRRLTPAEAGHDVVVIVDVSASMQARGAGGDRFTRARREAARLIDDLPEGGRMLLMTAGRRPVLRSGFETDRDALRRALAAAGPTDEVGRPRAALTLALSLLPDRETGHIHFITDAAFDDDVDIGAPRITYHEVGGQGRNVAITRFDLRREIGTAERFEVLLSVRNYTPQAVEVPARATLDGKPLFARVLRLPANGRESLVVPMRGQGAGRAEARVEIDDDLAADNRAQAVLTVQGSLSVLLLSAGNFYLESALAALPNVRVTRIPGLPEAGLARAARRHDVVVVDRIAVPALPPGRYLLIDSVAPGLPFAASGAVSQPAITGQGASALMRRVDVQAVKIDAASKVTIGDHPPGLQRLFWSDETELALALLHGETRVVFLGFDLARSNFPLQAGFPVFLGQSLAWLRPRAARLERTQHAAGETVTLPATAGASEVIVRRPDGEGVIYPLDGGPLRFDATAEAGIYRYTAADVHRYFAVNASDEDESDIAARATLPAGRVSAPSSARENRTEMLLWPYLTVVALLVLILEWALWSGRRAGA